MQRTRGAWFLLGFGLTIAAIWAGANVWTLLQERENSNHLTKIERIVVGLNRARKAPARGGDALQPAEAGQQPSPAHAPAAEHVGGSHHHHPPQHHHHAPKPPPTSSPSPPPSPPPPSTPQPESPPPAAPGNSGETPAAEHSEGVKACVNLVVSACAETGAPKLLP